MTESATQKASGGFRRALFIRFASKYASVLLQLVITAILARLLTPAEFGTVAIVTVFTSFFSVLTDMGLSPAIIQRKDLDNWDMSGLLSFAILLGLVLGTIFFLSAGIIAALYDDTNLIPLCRLASLSVVFSVANMVPNGVLLRKKTLQLLVRDC